MTNPDDAPKRKKPGPKPKTATPNADTTTPDAAADERMDALEAERAKIAEQAAADHDEDATPETVEPSGFPLIDGADPVWAVHASVGSRSVSFTARDGVTHSELQYLLGARSVTLPDSGEPLGIAARTMTPPNLAPVRVTFTVRERISQ